MHEVGHNRGAVQPAALQLHRQRAPTATTVTTSCVTRPTGRPAAVHDLPVRVDDPLRLRLQRLLRRRARARASTSEPLESRHGGQTSQAAAAAASSEPEDTTAPDTLDLVGPSREGAKRKATFRVHGLRRDHHDSQPQLRVQCGLGTFVPCASPQTYSASRDAVHRFEVRASMPAGIRPRTSRSAAFTWKVKV